MTRPHPEPRRDDAGRLLLSRHAVAYLHGRNVDHVRKTVPPVACDVAAHRDHPPSSSCRRCSATSAALLDADEAAELLAARRQRARTPRDTHDRVSC